MSSGIADKYDKFYRARDPLHVYPVEFVVRAFLGTYPRLSNAGVSHAGQTVLDLGCGDGRNMPLLTQLGMTVYGVELSPEICERTAERMRRLGVPVEIRPGRNRAVPFADAFFDQILACHSCYYVDPGTTFSDNLREIARVLKPGGRFVFSAPMASSYILEHAKDLGDGHMEIGQDPYGVRIGCILKKFDRAADIEIACADAFEDVRIGCCQNDFWGIEEHVWTVVCRRR